MEHQPFVETKRWMRVPGVLCIRYIVVSAHPRHLWWKRRKVSISDKAPNVDGKCCMREKKLYGEKAANRYNELALPTHGDTLSALGEVEKAYKLLG